VELLLVVVLVAVLMAALSPAIRTVQTGWKAGERRMEVLQNARVAFDEEISVLRQMKRVSAVSGPAETDGFIEFYDKDGNLMRFDLDSQSSFLHYGSVGALSALAGPVSALVFSCYDSSGALLADPVACGRIRSLALELTVIDSEGRVAPVSLSGRVFLRRDAAGAVINEIMYNPPGNQDKKLEWIELYNAGADAVDLAGWSLVSNANVTDPDTIEGDDRFGSGSTVLPAGGYAVVTADPSDVNVELLDDGGFEKNIKVTGWEYSSGWGRVKDGDNQEGTGKGARSGSGWLYQDLTLPGGAESAFFSCWEKTPSSVPGALRLVITLRDEDDTVLSTIYDGPMHGSWTRHTADLTPFLGLVDGMIRFETIGSGTYWLDDASLSWSYVPADALRLRVDDADLGGQLDNYEDMAAFMNAGVLIDMTEYENAWGGYGNGRTIERISAAGDSMDPANWDEGPANGTPGRLNEASQ